MPTQTVEQLADALIRELYGMRRVVRQQLRPRLPGPPLRGSQVELLQVVEESPGIGIAAAARALHLAGNTVSALAGQLAAGGYLRRQTDPAEVADTAVFLGSDLGRGVTGNVIYVDSGFQVMGLLQH